MSLTTITESPWTLDVLGTPAVAFTACGQPAPQGSKTAGVTRTGRTFVKESSAAVMPWRSAVTTAAVLARSHDWQPLDGPVVADMVFTVRRPASAPKRRRVRPDRSPDLDKLVRATCDAISDAGLWVDDGRLVAFRRCEELYAGDPDPDALPSGETGVVVRLWSVEVTAA